jgi:threonine aldolase
VHLDGARIFNAALVLETSAGQIAGFADSVSFCLSKGLGCPVGSLLCGSSEFIARARHIRKALGGGMRQAGIIAAAGLVALDTMVDRLAEDHLNARLLTEGLSQVAGIKVRRTKRATNMVVFDVAGDERSSADFATRLKERGVLVGARGSTAFRAVTHYGISQDDVNRAITAAHAAAAGVA